MSAFLTARQVRFGVFERQRYSDFAHACFLPKCSLQHSAHMTKIEIEKKFKVSQDAKRKLSDDAVRNEDVVSSFTDTYFSEELALMNIWLRKRSNVWEMKVPVNSCNQLGGAAVFEELVGVEVWKMLTQNGTFAHSLKPYARIHTLRTLIKFSWDLHEINCTLDECSSEDGFNYAIGEVEILVETPKEVQDAVNVLDKLIAHFDLEELYETDGKLLSYLRAQNESLYAKVVNVLRNGGACNREQ